MHEFFGKQNLKLVYEKKKGRHVLADTNFKKGDLVLESPPYAAGFHDTLEISYNSFLSSLFIIIFISLLCYLYIYISSGY